MKNKYSGLGSSVQFLLTGLVTLLLSLTLFIGCSTVKPVAKLPAEKKPFPEKIDTLPAKVVIPEKMDTIIWVQKDTLKSPPIIVDQPDQLDDPLKSDKQDLTKYHKDIYRIGVLLPFQAGDSIISSANRMANWAMDFYLGFKLAFEEGVPSNTKFHIETFDTQGNEDKIDILVAKGTLKDKDVLIGPYRSNTALKLANYVKDIPTLLISPYSANARIGTGNSHYLQLNPSLDRHLQALFELGRSMANADNPVVFLYGFGESESSKKFIWDAFISGLPALEKPFFHAVQIESTELDLKSVDINTLIPGLTGSTIILPSWEESTVLSVMRKLVAEKLDRTVTLLGLPQWLNFHQLQGAHLEALNVHISSADFYDPRDMKMQQLSQRYREAYGQLLNTDSVWGFRCGQYIKETLPRDGSLFQRFIPDYTSRQTKFKIPDFRVIKSDNGQFQNIENISLQILRFQEGVYVPVK